MTSHSEPAPGGVLDAALLYAARGWAVFPVRGKLPLTSDGFKSASRESGAISAWWTQQPDAGVAIATGKASGLVILDEDTAKGGGKTRAALEHQHGKLKTYTVLTGGGGRHFYFAHPGGDIRCSAGKLGPGLDVRGDGGYVVAPPSMHASGKPYKVLDAAPLAPLPGWLLEEAAARQNGGAALVGDEIRQGERDTTLTSLAGTMRRRGMDEAAILAALRVTNRDRCQPPLDDSELARIAASIARYEPGDERSEQPPVLTVQTVRALCAITTAAGAEELLGPLVRRGQRIAVGAHTGEGKTVMTRQMVRAIVLGEPFLDWQGAGAVRALIIDAEQELWSVQEQLRALRLEQSEAIDYLCVPDGLALDESPEQIASLEAELKRGEYALVVADPLYKLHRGDSNDERAAVDLMRVFDTWRARYGFALIMPVHLRKRIPGSKFSIDDLFGSSAYSRGAEVVLGLQLLGDGYSRLHFLKSRDPGLPVRERWGLLYDRGRGFTRDENDGAPSTAERLRELREADPEITQKRAALALGVVSKTIQRHWKVTAPETQESLLDEVGE